MAQGVPSTYYGNKKPSFNDKRPEGQASTHERDDTIDLKPPAIIPQFVPETNKHEGPYAKPPAVNKAETRPTLYLRPEIITHSSEVKQNQVPQFNKIDQTE